MLYVNVYKYFIKSIFYSIRKNKNKAFFKIHHCFTPDYREEAGVLRGSNILTNLGKKMSKKARTETPGL